MKEEGESNKVAVERRRLVETVADEVVNVNVAHAAHVFLHVLQRDVWI